MSFVKFGYNALKDAFQVTVDGIPLRQYLDMKHNERALITLVEKLLTCCDEERDAALIQEAHALLARIKGGVDD